MDLMEVGVRSKDGTVAYRKKFWEEYDPIPTNLAREIDKYESVPRHEAKSSLTSETFHRLREENIEARKKFRMEMQDELKQQRTGRILHMNHFLLLLRSAGLKAWYADHQAFQGMVGLYVSVDGDDQTYICFAQIPYMQEFEEVYFDEYDLPLGPKRRGWRTILLRLISKGILTEAKAHEVFGEPPTGPVSRRYRQELQRLRNSNITKENANGA